MLQMPCFALATINVHTRLHVATTMLQDSCRRYDLSSTAQSTIYIAYLISRLGDYKAKHAAVTPKLGSTLSVHRAPICHEYS